MCSPDVSFLRLHLFATVSNRLCEGHKALPRQKYIQRPVKTTHQRMLALPLADAPGVVYMSVTCAAAVLMEIAKEACVSASSQHYCRRNSTWCLTLSILSTLSSRPPIHSSSPPLLLSHPTLHYHLLSPLPVLTN